MKDMDMDPYEPDPFSTVCIFDRSFVGHFSPDHRIIVQRIGSVNPFRG